MFDGIDATVLLGILVTEQFGRHRPARTGRLIYGSVAQVLGAEGREVPAGHSGCGDLPGPTGCPYLSGAKQADDAQDGWDVTGGTILADAKGDLQITARNDDLVVEAPHVWTLREHMRSAIAPCEFTCRMVLAEGLLKTAAGKARRFLLKSGASEQGTSP